MTKEDTTLGHNKSDINVSDFRKLPQLIQVSALSVHKVKILRSMVNLIWLSAQSAIREVSHVTYLLITDDLITK